MMMTARRLLLATLPWVLISRVAMMECTGDTCVPSADMPLSSKMVVTSASFMAHEK
jgi:hypothetical protein